MSATGRAISFADDVHDVDPLTSDRIQYSGTQAEAIINTWGLEIMYF